MPRSPPVAVDLADLEKNGSAIPTDSVELWICMDFEWTCDDGENRVVHSEEGEIIEFSYAVYDARAGELACEGQHYCKNLRTPITDFCRNLTGITEQTLADAGSLQDALHALERALNSEKCAGRPCCAVTHGSADLELMLPGNCRALGLEVPRVLRKYVDLREATQTHLHARGIKGFRASTLKQICEALEVQMFGEEHCGLDDSWMVLMATQELLKVGADMLAVDLDKERQQILSGASRSQRLCLDGLPFFSLEPEVRPWLQELAGQELAEGSLSVVLGLDGRPTGRAVVDLGSHAAAARMLEVLDGGRRLECGPPEDAKERLILVRPLRRQELALPVVPASGSDGPGLAPFPASMQALDAMRGTRRDKGKGKGRFQPAAAEDCEGRVKNFLEAKGFGFLQYSGGEVFFHMNDWLGEESPHEGDVVTFDVRRDPRNSKMKACCVRKLQAPRAEAPPSQDEPAGAA